jgi:hypothetical protein
MRTTPTSVLRHRLPVAILLLALAQALQAQDGGVRGFVTDASTGRPLPGANVAVILLDNRLAGAVTDGRGYYLVSRLPDGPLILRVSFVGFRTRTDTLSLPTGGLITHHVDLTPSAEALDEVVVSADQAPGMERLEAGYQRISAATLRKLPTPDVSGDLAGSLQRMPGVQSGGDRGGQLFVRGGTPGENLVLVDGLPVFLPFHLLSHFSAFPEDVVSYADVFAGSFGARYQGRISSAVDVVLRPGNTRRPEAAVSTSPLISSIRLEGPLTPRASSLLFSARRSNIESAAPFLLGRDLPLAFGDAILRYQREGAYSRCSVTGLHTYDRGTTADIALAPEFHWSNTVLGGRCLAISPDSPVLVELVGGFSAVQNEVDDPVYSDRRASMRRILTEVHLTIPTRRADLRWGVQAFADRLGYRLAEQYQGFREDARFLMGLSGYLEAEFPRRFGLVVKPGVAVTAPLDYPGSIEPRLSVQWEPEENGPTAIQGAIGSYRQTLAAVRDERDAGSAFMAWIPTPIDEKPTHALQAVLGVRSRFHNGLEGAIEGYARDIRRIAVPALEETTRFTTRLVRADARVAGLEIRGGFHRGGMDLFLGYGLSWTRYRSNDAFGSWFGRDVEAYFPPHDRRHSLSTLISWTIADFELNAGWEYGSGFPFTPLFGRDTAIDLTGLPDVRRVYGRPRLLYDTPYSGRLPSFHRLDVSVRRAFEFSAGRLLAQIGAVNLYDRLNLFTYDLLRDLRIDQLPIVPYAAIRLETR